MTSIIITALGIIILLSIGTLVPGLSYEMSTVPVTESSSSMGHYSIFNMTVSNGTVPIRYNVTSGNVFEGMMFHYKTMAVNIGGYAGKTGQLTVEIPRTLLDSKYANSTDKQFKISMELPDGAIVGTNHFKEISNNSQSRTLSIDIPPRALSYTIDVEGTMTNQQPDKIIAPRIDPPLQQIRLGKSSGDVTCKEEFELVHKAADNIPACVKPDNMVTLVQRGWAENPLSGSYDKYLTHDQQNTLLYKAMYLKGIRDWSTAGWKLMGAVVEDYGNGTVTSDVSLYLPPGIHKATGQFCGWHAWVRVDLKTLDIINSYYPSNNSQDCNVYHPPWE